MICTAEHINLSMMLRIRKTKNTTERDETRQRVKRRDVRECVGAEMKNTGHPLIDLHDNMFLFTCCIRLASRCRKRKRGGGNITWTKHNPRFLVARQGFSSEIAWTADWCWQVCEKSSNKNTKHNTRVAMPISRHVVQPVLRKHCAAALHSISSLFRASSRSTSSLLRRSTRSA